MDDVELETHRPARLTNVIARLAGANSLMVVLAFATSPILARALGPVGRGEVAAMLAVVQLAPSVTEMGMTLFTSRAHIQRTAPLGDLLGTVLPIVLLGSLVPVALSVPLAHLIGHGRRDVVLYIEIGVFTIPVVVIGQTLSAITTAEQRWGTFVLTKLLNVIGYAASILVLALLGDLSVATVCIANIAWSVVTVMPFFRELLGAGRLRFVRSLAASGMAFGIKSWLSNIASTGNQQLDQVLMAALLPSRQLGLYSLAVTLATASGSLVGAVALAIVPRVAGGDAALAARASRLTLWLILIINAIGAGLSPWLVPVLFSSKFDGTIPLLLILLVGSVFYVHSTILGYGLVADGHPAGSAVAQIAGLVVTVPGLILLLPVMGALGAALITLVAYLITFFITLYYAVSRFGFSLSTLLIPTLGDLSWLRGRLLSMLQKLTKRRPSNAKSPQ